MSSPASGILLDHSYECIGRNRLPEGRTDRDGHDEVKHIRAYDRPTARDMQRHNKGHVHHNANDLDVDNRISSGEEEVDVIYRLQGANATHRN